MANFARTDGRGPRSGPPRWVVAAVAGALSIMAPPSDAQPLTRPPPPTPAPVEAALVIAPAPLVAAMASRLEGHRSRIGDHVLLLEDVAQQGRPWVGVVIARCGQLWLETAVVALRLSGPLARMRVAGPGYLVWAVGTRRSSRDGPGDELAVTRLGVLAPPDELAKIAGSQRAARSAPVPGLPAPCP